MSEPTTLGVVSPEERLKRLESAFHAKIEALTAKAEEKALGELSGMVARLEQPIRPEILNTRGEPVVKLSVPWEREYRRMPEDERGIRNPDSDHWIAEWWRGVRENDKIQYHTAADKLRAMFPEMYARADTLEGAAGASGAFAAGTGGVLMPRPLEALVAIARDRTAKMWRWATTYTMTTQQHNIPTGGAMTAAMSDEGTTPAGGEPTFAQAPLVAFNAIAKAIVGNDMMADTAINLVSFLTRKGGARLGALEDEQFCKAGTGSAPNVTKISGTAFAEATTNALAYTDIIGMFNAIGQENRVGARWLVATNVLGFMMGVRDGMGRPFYSDLLSPPRALGDSPDGSPGPESQGTLLGYPVQDMPFTNGDIWFGNPANVYAIGRREGITVEVSKEFLFDTRRTMFLIRQRIAGNNIETAAARLCSGITSATSA